MMTRSPICCIKDNGENRLNLIYIKVLPFSSTKMCSADDNPDMRYESLAWRCTKYTMVNSFHLPLSPTYGCIRRDNIQSTVTTDYFHQICL